MLNILSRHFSRRLLSFYPIYLLLYGNAIIDKNLMYGVVGADSVRNDPHQEQSEATYRDLGESQQHGAVDLSIQDQPTVGM